MTIEKLKELFENEFSSEHSLYKQDRSFVDAPRSTPFYQFYPIKALSELQQHVIQTSYESLGTPKDDFDRQEQNDELLARFTVDSDYQLLFAKEGALSRITPAHSDMTEVCYTAGNVRFSATDFETITEISNKSGHFKPSVASLLWMVAVLYANQEGFKFAPVIKLCGVSIKAEDYFEISLSKEELFDLLPTALKEDKHLMDAFIANNQSKDIVQVGQDNKRPKVGGFFPEPRAAGATGNLGKLFFSRL
jgi:hypothetical protein